jgi:hypothetical protein
LLLVSIQHDAAVHDHVGVGGAHVAGLGSVKVVELIWLVQPVELSLVEAMIGALVPGAAHATW